MFSMSKSISHHCREYSNIYFGIDRGTERMFDDRYVYLLVDSKEEFDEIHLAQGNNPKIIYTNRTEFMADQTTDTYDGSSTCHYFAASSKAGDALYSERHASGEYKIGMRRAPCLCSSCRSEPPNNCQFNFKGEFRILTRMKKSDSENKKNIVAAVKRMELYASVKGILAREPEPLPNALRVKQEFKPILKFFNQKGAGPRGTVFELFEGLGGFTNLRNRVLEFKMNDMLPLEALAAQEDILAPP